MKILFVGGGNMAFAIISGLINKKHEIYVIDPVVSARKKFKKLLKSKSTNTSKIFFFKGLEEFIAKEVTTSWIVFAIKPQQITNVFKEIGRTDGAMFNRTPILSIVAGLKIKTIKKITGNKNIVRAMPNTPSLIKMGITGYSTTKHISLRILKQAEKILSQVGEVERLPNEKLIDAVTAVSGSGPGYVFKFISALEKAAIKTGLPKCYLKKFLFWTLKGSLYLWNYSEESSNDLINKVASKGGTTQEAIDFLNKGNFDELIVLAVEKAKIKSEDISLELDRQI